MKAGDTLYIPIPGASLDSHLWFVISDTTKSDSCIIANFTSWREDKDQACVVNKGDHPYLAKRSCVNFKESKQVKLADLEALIQSGVAEKRAPLSPGLLQKIRSAVAESRMNFDHAQILAEQGLVDI